MVDKIMLQSIMNLAVSLMGENGEKSDFVESVKQKFPELTIVYDGHSVTVI